MPLHFGRFHPCQFLDDSSHGYAKYSIYLSDDPLAAQRFCCTRLYFSVGAKTFLSQKPFSYSAFLRSRAKKILLPYLIWIGIYYAFFIMIGWYRFSIRDLIEYIFLGTLCSHFYFVVIIAQFYLLLPIFRMLFSRFDARLLCAAALLITVSFKLFVHIQYEDRMFPGYLLYFTLGATAGKNYEKFCTRIQKRFSLICAAFALFATTDAYFTWRSMARGEIFPWMEALHIAYAISAILFFFGLCLYISKALKRPLQFIFICERSTYMIYLSHILPIYVANELAVRLSITGMAATFLFRAVFTYTTAFAGCILYTAVKENFLHRRKKTV